MSDRGHLFVVHGRIESLVHDAAVVPVDEWLNFTPSWRPLLGDVWPSRPARWDVGWGRVAGRDQWLVKTGDSPYDAVLDRLGPLLEDVAGAELTPSGRRVRPLVAMPVVGVGLGGHAHEPGLVVRRLVERLESLTTELDIDVGLVTPEPSVYAAAQYARRALASPLDVDFEQAARALGERAGRGDLALFLGAGVSIPAGLKSWNDLISKLAEHATGVDVHDLVNLSATDQAEFIERVDPEGFQRRVAELIRPAERPALLHGLLAGLDIGQVVTTNYDLLYEKAMRAAGRTVHSVMPWASALGTRRWVLKWHGDAEHEDSIVLTRRHMVRYDAGNRPSAAMLQSLFLTKHLLVIGASLTDDNVIRLAHEVQAYRDEHQSDTDSAFGTVLDASAGGDRIRGQLWRGQLEWLHLSDADAGSPTRSLELMLDRIALHASQDSSWLLDERFAGLLPSAADREIARQARELFAAAERRSSHAWRPLMALRI